MSQSNQQSMRPSLQFNLHPDTHSIAELKTTEYDVICIGSGWAGRTLAAQVVKAGYTAIVIEKELFGGDCPFWACVPSKVLLRSNEALESAKAVGGARERVDMTQAVDVAGTFARRDQITANKDDTAVLVPMIEAAGVAMVRGTGKLVGVKKVSVTSVEGKSVVLQAKLAVAICSGSEARMPEAVKAADPWTPRDATSSSVAPTSLIVMGAGAVGCELATAYANFGSRVTLVSSSGGLLPNLDGEAGKLVSEALEKKGVIVKLAARVVNAVRVNGEVKVELSNGETMQAAELLVAAGRKATLDVGLESVGIKHADSWISVDDSMTVDVPGNEKWLYAPGDINGRAPFTHIGKYQGRIAANAIISRAQGRSEHGPEWKRCIAIADKTATPSVVFTSPIVASVGLTRMGAAKIGKPVRQITAPVFSVGKLLHADDMSQGWAQWLVDDEERLVGATFVGSEATELLHGSTVAIAGRLTLTDLLHAVPSFPTLSEVYLNLIDAAGL